MCMVASGLCAVCDGWMCVCVHERYVCACSCVPVCGMSRYICIFVHNVQYMCIWVCDVFMHVYLWVR